MIDLMSIARTEADGGDLFSVFDGMFEASDVKPDGSPDAVVWKGGNHDGSVNPVAHSLTDAYALLGTLAAIDILGLPYYAVPMWSQYRHDQKLAPLSWFGNMPVTSIKWSTAGDAYVNDADGSRVVVMGKSGNAPLRTQAGVYCNVRPYGPVTVVRCMPCLPYSQNRPLFNVDPDTGLVHSEMNSPGVQMAYANQVIVVPGYGLAVAQAQFGADAQFIAELGPTEFAGIMAGPVAETALTEATQKIGCIWGIPQSDGAFTVVVAALPQASRDTLTTALGTSVFTGTLIGTAPAYTWERDDALGRERVEVVRDVHHHARRPQRAIVAVRRRGRGEGGRGHLRALRPAGLEEPVLVVHTRVAREEDARALAVVAVVAAAPQHRKQFFEVLDIVAVVRGVVGRRAHGHAGAFAPRAAIF